MKSFTLLNLAAAVLAMPQSSSSGCQSSVSGSFSLTNVYANSKRDLEKRQAITLSLTLANGILTDSKGRLGYIASNNQFQFDNPVQPGSKASSGWSICSGNLLALGGSTTFYQCLSGSFYNLYNAPVGAGCIKINFVANMASGAASQAPDGQPQASNPVSQITDGQPQATAPVSQITDGQPQAPKPTSMVPAVSQITDGQPQAPKPTSMAPAVSQITDGQPQAPAPTSAAAAVSQITDGQPQAPKPTSAGVAVSQISDGQPQATLPASAVPSYTAGAAFIGGNAGAFALGVFGLVAFL